MPTRATQAQEHQARWNEVIADPALKDLPYKVETSTRGQIALSPRTNRHSDLQTAVFQLLQQHVPDGHISVEYALATPRGVKAPDVVCMSAERRDEMRATGDPSTLAPELCVAVTSETNTEEEMRAKRDLYAEIGAEEVWVVNQEGEIQVFGADENERSNIAPECPPSVSVSD